MKKTLLAIFCALILSVTAICASACSFFGGEKETRQIERIYSEPGEKDGITGTYIIVEYVGDEYENDMFFIADAEAGKEGTGISNITTKLNEDGTTTITIEYSDPSKYPAEFTIPNGLYIRNIVSDTDPETGERTLTIVFSDPTMEPIVVTVPSGKDGKDGDKIKDIYTDEDEEGNTVVHVVVSRFNEETGEWEDDESTTFTIPKGKQGRGIASISLNAYQTSIDPQNFHLDIIYDNGEFETITFSRVNCWYTGAGEPNAGMYNVGDFYLDTINYAIYQKLTTGWEKLIDFGAYSQEQHSVFFYIDGTHTHTAYIMHGYNFASTPEYSLTNPAKEGYKFLGWFTEYVDPDNLENANPNSGQFTDLTPVMSNITLYARWQKIS